MRSGLSWHGQRFIGLVASFCAVLIVAPWLTWGDADGTRVVNGARVAQAAAPARIAIYSGSGAEPDSILATFKALGDMGHSPQAIVKADITHGKLTAANFDLLIFPAGQENSDLEYSQFLDLAEKNAVKNYVSGGGNLIGIAEGAKFIVRLGIYSGTSRNRALDAAPNTMQGITVADPAFAPVGTSYSVYVSEGANSFGGVPANATVVASYSNNGKPAIVRFPYGSGRVVMIAPNLELDVTSDNDWVRWDNLVTGGVDPELDWPFLGQLVSWAYTGTVMTPTITSAPLAGARIAIYSTRTADGGAWGGLLPALARMLAFNGDTPIAIRDVEVKNGGLVKATYPVVVFPGGYAYGYKQQLLGYEQKLRDYVSSGGSYMGISAGAFYVCDTIVWEGVTYDYPVNLFLGKETGSINDIAPWPTYNLTPIAMTDATLGTPQTFTTLFYGEGYFTMPSPTLQAADVSATYAYGGTAAGLPAMVKFRYGSGKVFLPNLHLEAEEGSLRDWTFWDNFDNNGNPWTDPDSEWPFMQTAVGWLKAP